MDHMTREKRAERRLLAAREAIRTGDVPGAARRHGVSVRTVYLGMAAISNVLATIPTAKCCTRCGLEWEDDERHVCPPGFTKPRKKRSKK